MKNKLLKLGNIWTYILSFSASAIGIVLNFFLARVLAADLFGRLQYLIALATTLSQLIIFGINSFLIREAKNEKRDPGFVNDCFTLFFMITMLAIPIMHYVLINRIAYTSNNEYLTIIYKLDEN